MAQESTAPSPAQVHDLLAEAMEGTIGVRNPRPEVLDRALRAAREAAPVMRGPDGKRDASACEELGKELPGDLRAWLFELPSFLAKKGREEQGQELCDLYSPLFGPECMEAERAIVFLEAGKKEDARAYWEKCHEQYGEHPWVLLRGAALHERTGDVRGARRLHERALEAARGHEDRWQLRFAYDGLIHHLQENNEQAASVELGRRMLEDLPEIRDEFKTEQIVNTVPKVGRNDPCPCGSGKKYKKCCGHS